MACPFRGSEDHEEEPVDDDVDSETNVVPGPRPIGVPVVAPAQASAVGVREKREVGEGVGATVALEPEPVGVPAGVPPPGVPAQIPIPTGGDVVPRGAVVLEEMRDAISANVPAGAPISPQQLTNMAEASMIKHLEGLPKENVVVQAAEEAAAVASEAAAQPAQPGPGFPYEALGIPFLRVLWAYGFKGFSSEIQKALRANPQGPTGQSPHRFSQSAFSGQMSGARPSRPTPLAGQRIGMGAAGRVFQTRDALHQIMNPGRGVR